MNILSEQKAFTVISQWNVGRVAVYLQMKVTFPVNIAFLLYLHFVLVTNLHFVFCLTVSLNQWCWTYKEFSSFSLSKHSCLFLVNYIVKYPFITIWFYFFSFSLPSIQRFLVSFKNYWIGPETLLYLWIQMESHSIVYALKKIDVAKLFIKLIFHVYF